MQRKKQILVVALNFMFVNLNWSIYSAQRAGYLNEISFLATIQKNIIVTFNK